MLFIQRAREWCAAWFVLLVAAVAAPAAADDSALNKEGFWTVGRGELTSDACYASLNVEGGGLFILRATDGAATFIVQGARKFGRAKAGVLATDKVRFDFTPAVDGGLLLQDGDLAPAAIAALREADDVVVVLDGKPVLNARTAGSGIAGAVDAVLACSKGEKGWWGPGVTRAGGSATAPAAGLNKEGFWAVVPDERGEVCVAVVGVTDDLSFAVVSASGRFAVALTSKTTLPRGRRGRFETDAYGFDFAATYEGRDYVYSPDLDSQAVFALRRAKSAKFAIDGKVLADMVLEDTGLPQVMDDVDACARGEAGWWGKGAPKR